MIEKISYEDTLENGEHVHLHTHVLVTEMEKNGQKFCKRKFILEKNLVNKM